MTLTLGGEEVELLPSGGVLVQDALIVADLHLGKERAFRQQGVSVPEGPSGETLAKLSRELDQTNPSRLIFLGDLFHHQRAIAGCTIESLKSCLALYPGVHPMLVRGNHDRIPPALQDALETVDEIHLDGLSLHHHPQDPEDPHLAGHLHPAVTLRDERGGVRLRCFWRHQERLVLPAFGEFTGCLEIEPVTGDEFYVPHGSTIRRLCFPR